MFKRLIASLVCFTFIFSNLQYSQAQPASPAGGGFSINQLPVPGTMVGVSAPFAPLALKGLIVNPQKPLEFQFIVDTGNSFSKGMSSPNVLAGNPQPEQLKQQVNLLVKYFLAGLTIPEGDLWVNLSPYEKDHMVPEALGQTDLGRDLLAQDYILKQLTASLIYPEKKLGKEFWSRVYAKSQQQFGTTDVPVNTFNKVWILPDQAQVFENGNTAYVTKSTLKVMLDEDYLAFSRHSEGAHSTTEESQGVLRSFANAQDDKTRTLASQIVRAIILPEIEKEVNTGKNFAPLRQIYQALILAKWYKETIQNGLLDAVYTNKKKVAGVNVDDPAVKEQIYNRYLQAYKKGAFNFIKEDPTPDGQVIPRKYFSGGTNFSKYPLERTHDVAMLSAKLRRTIGAFLIVSGVLGSTFSRSYRQEKLIKPQIMIALNASQDELVNKILSNKDYSSRQRADFYRALIKNLDSQKVSDLNRLILKSAINDIFKLANSFTPPDRYSLLLGRDDRNKLAAHDRRIQEELNSYKALFIAIGRGVGPYLQAMRTDERYGVSGRTKKAIDDLIRAITGEIEKGTQSRLQTPKRTRDAAMMLGFGKMPVGYWFLRGNVEKILPELSDGNKRVRLDAENYLEILGASNEQMIRGYLAALSSGSLEARSNAATKLLGIEAKAGKEEIFNAYITALPLGYARNYVIKRLGDLGDINSPNPVDGLLRQRAIEALFPLLQDKDVYKSAEAALEKLGASAKRLIDGYIAALSSKDVATRNNAVNKLGDLADKRDEHVINALLPLLQNGEVYDEHAGSRDKYVYRAVEKVLARLRASTEQQVRGYIAALSSPDFGVRNNAIGNLGILGKKSDVMLKRAIIIALLGMLREPNSYTFAEDALTNLGASNDRMIDGYIGALSSRYDVPRYHAVRQLERLGAKRAINPLLNMLKDTIYGRSTAAAEKALGTLGYNFADQAMLRTQAPKIQDTTMLDKIPSLVSREAAQEAKAKPDLAMITISDNVLYAAASTAALVVVWRRIKSLIIENIVKKSLAIYSNLNYAGRTNWDKTLIRWIDETPSSNFSPGSNNTPYQLPKYVILNTNLRIKVIQALLESFMVADADTGIDVKAAIYPTTRSISLAFQEGTLTPKSKEILRGTLAAMTRIFTERQKEPLLAPRADRALEELQGIWRSIDSAMLLAPKQTTTDKAALARDLGGIDLNKINVNRTGKTVNVQFDPAQLEELMQGGFAGFTPVIINITPISNPLPLLGIGPAKEDGALVKV